MKTISCVGAAILFIIATILLIFGVLFIWGAFSPDGSTGWILTGVIIVGIALACVAGGIVLVIYNRRSQAANVAASNVTLNVDLPGNVKMDSMKCQSCGGVLTKDSIQMLAGAPVVSCPFCGTTYQLTEEPKW
jgi:hypothetical protein